MDLLLELLRAATNLDHKYFATENFLWIFFLATFLKNNKKYTSVTTFDIVSIVAIVNTVTAVLIFSSFFVIILPRKAFITFMVLFCETIYTRDHQE